MTLQQRLLIVAGENHDELLEQFHKAIKHGGHVSRFEIGLAEILFVLNDRKAVDGESASAEQTLAKWECCLEAAFCWGW